MLVQILSPIKIKITISSSYILCIISDGYAKLLLTTFRGEEISELDAIEDVNTLSQAIDILYEEYTTGELYNRIKYIEGIY